MTNEELLEKINEGFTNLEKRLRAAWKEDLDEVEESIVRRVGAVGQELDLHKRDPHAHIQAAG